jgi:hypothetical protein
MAGVKEIYGSIIPLAIMPFDVIFFLMIISLNVLSL